jgi:membrane protease YdiL (CAAX protease family)
MKISENFDAEKVSFRDLPDKISTQQLPKALRGVSLVRKIWISIGWVSWFGLSFIGAQFLVVLPFLLSDRGTLKHTSDSVLLLLNAGVYALMLLLFIGLPIILSGKRAAKHVGLSGNPVASRSKKGFWQLVGLSRRPKMVDVWYLLASIPIYYFVLLAAMLAARIVLGGDVMDQSQDLGFAKTGNSSLEIGVIFVALVVIPPLCEELMMRGFLFGKLRKVLSFWPTAILVSLTFAVAHWQINVGIDTFILSMVLCHIREKTGTIWGTIALHVVKNFVAFALLFL